MFSKSLANCSGNGGMYHADSRGVSMMAFVSVVGGHD